MRSKSFLNVVSILADIITGISFLLFVIPGLYSAIIFAVLTIINIILLFVSYRENIVQTAKNPTIILLLFLVFSTLCVKCVMYLINYGDQTIFNLVDYFRFCLFSFYLLAYSKMNLSCKKRFKYIMSILFVILFIICLRTTITLFFNPMISRYIATGTSTYSFLETFLVASYNDIYGLVFVFIYLLYVIFSNKTRLSKSLLTICIVFEVVAFICIIKSSFAYAIFFSLISFLFIPYWIGKSRIYYFLIPSLIIAIPVLGTIFLYVFQSSKSMLIDRIREICYLVTFRFTKQSELYVRFQLIGDSFKTCIKNPVFGAGAYYSGESAVYADIGGHSSIADTLARYGLLFGIQFLSLFVLMFVVTKKVFKVGGYYQILICFSFLSLINPTRYSNLLFYVFVFIPFLNISYFDKIYKNERVEMISSNEVFYDEIKI